MLSHNDNPLKAKELFPTPVLWGAHFTPQSLSVSICKVGQDDQHSMWQNHVNTDVLFKYSDLKREEEATSILLPPVHAHFDGIFLINANFLTKILLFKEW